MGVALSFGLDIVSVVQETCFGDGLEDFSDVIVSFRLETFNGRSILSENFSSMFGVWGTEVDGMLLSRALFLFSDAVFRFVPLAVSCCCATSPFVSVKKTCVSCCTVVIIMSIWCGVQKISNWRGTLTRMDPFFVPVF